MGNTKKHLITYMAIFLFLLFGTISYSSEALYWLTPEERQWLKDHPVITYAIDPEFAPFEYYGDDEMPQGIYVEALNLLERQMGVDIDMSSSPVCESNI